ncbi:MAG: antibiotic biosynthesis monooxygenase [Micropruina sp.]|nr:antibiotic biosynthesis monooxygenase [Micropruina sp.]
MITTVCNVHVTAEGVEAFKAASLANAEGSRNEPGVTRFDLLQQVDDPTRFVLYEEYVDEAATQAHKQTPHYLAWREAVTDLMATPRATYSFGDRL